MQPGLMVRLFFSEWTQASLPLIPSAHLESIFPDIIEGPAKANLRKNLYRLFVS
jgi:hypothetical protein